MGKRPKNTAADPGIEIIAASGDIDTGILEPFAAPATVADLIAEVAAAVVPAARETGAAKFGVEFGVRTRKDGSAALADGPGLGTYRVFLEWDARG